MKNITELEQKVINVINTGDDWYEIRSHDYFGNLRRNRNPYETTAGRYQLTRAEGHHSRERASNLHSLDGLRIIYELESNTHKLSANSESFFMSALIEVSDFSARSAESFPETL